MSANSVSEETASFLAQIQSVQIRKIFFLDFLLGHPLEGVPGCQCSESSFHVSIDKGQAKDIACVYPAESRIKALVCSLMNGYEGRETCPSLATPLKSLPWLPYSASTR